MISEAVDEDLFLQQENGTREHCCADLASYRKATGASPVTSEGR